MRNERTAQTLEEAEREYVQEAKKLKIGEESRARFYEAQAHRDVRCVGKCYVAALDAQAAIKLIIEEFGNADAVSAVAAPQENCEKYEETH